MTGTTGEENVAKMITEIRQLERKQGPWFDKWLAGYKRWFDRHGKGIAQRYDMDYWARGIYSYISYQESKRNRISDRSGT